MTKRKTAAAIFIFAILVISLTGCAVAFPKSADKLIANTEMVWSDSGSSVVDTFKLSKIVMIIPVQMPELGDHDLTITINGGEITSERVFDDEKILLNLSFDKIDLTIDKKVNSFLEPRGIFINKFSLVNGSINIEFTPTTLKADIIVNNLNQVVSDLPPIYSKQETFTRSDYADIFKKVKLFGLKSVFGTIMNNGVLNKDSNSYAYDLPKANVHDELLRLPKLLIDILGSNKFEGSSSSLHDILINYFDTQNIVNIANKILTPKDIKVSCNLDKTDKKYYISKLSGNYMAAGKVSQQTTEKIFDDIIKNLDKGELSDILSMVKIKEGLTIPSANVAITSRIKLK